MVEVMIPRSKPKRKPPIARKNRTEDRDALSHCASVCCFCSFSDFWGQGRKKQPRSRTWYRWGRSTIFYTSITCYPQSLRRANDFAYCTSRWSLHLRLKDEPRFHHGNLVRLHSRVPGWSRIWGSSQRFLSSLLLTISAPSVPQPHILSQANGFKPPVVEPSH